MMEWLAGHMLGDFLLQNKWLGEKKLETQWGLFLHVVIVTVCVCLFTGWLDFRGILVFLSHGIIDGSRIGKRWPEIFKQGKPYSDEPPAMWLGLVMDQALHIVCYTVISAI